MKSSTGEHYIALDHVRALAAYMVFAWHFNHSTDGYPVPFEFVPAVFPLALLDEGHTGVALFMTLSGYLFAKLLDGKSIRYSAFLWNRILRLLPLLVVVVSIVGARRVLSGDNVFAFMYGIARGAVLPSLPNGGWSITAEFHYYLILPVLLWMLRKATWWPLVVVGMAVVLRGVLYWQRDEVQTLAYWTIIGRIDQFVIGMVVYQCRGLFAHRHVLAGGLLTLFALFYWQFDAHGGFLHNPAYPSTNPVWIILPTIEATAYAVGISWYEGSFTQSGSGLSRFVGRIGEYSYSIYLLHFFVVFEAARYVHEHWMDISNFYLASLWALAFFLLMMPVGYLSFRFIEGPFLRLRKRYVLGRPVSTQAS